MKPDLEQEKAAKYTNGHSLIIAGAGSGKTTTLLLKVDYLINSGIKENEILVISFTNETVNNFINKCKYKIDVMTFHKLANTVIKSKKDIVGRELLEDCIKEFFTKIPHKLKKKIFHSFYTLIFTKRGYYKKTNTFTTEAIITYFYSAINQLRANNIDLDNININDFNNREKIAVFCIRNIIRYYNSVLKNNDLIDFDNLITEATINIKNNKYKSRYKHILVDEYQDISKLRLDFLKALINSNNSVLTAVGDDFQAIYGFNGSKIDLFYDFEKHFKNAKIFYISTSYRCPRRILKIAGNFIMKNPYQIKKEMKANSKIKGKIVKIISRGLNSDLIKVIRKYRKSKYSVLILGRNGFDINFYIKKKNSVDNTYIIYKNKVCKNIRYLTIHKSKGLEADIVVLINLSADLNGFPRAEINEIVKKLIKTNETYEYAEERRLMYVALTRCKIKAILIINRSAVSPFIKEL